MEQSVIHVQVSGNNYESRCGTRINSPIMPFKLKDRVRRIGQPTEVGTVEDIREPDDEVLRLNPTCETMYWIRLGRDF